MRGGAAQAGKCLVLKRLWHIQRYSSHTGAIWRRVWPHSPGVSGWDACCAADCSLHMFEQLPLGRWRVNICWSGSPFSSKSTCFPPLLFNVSVLISAALFLWDPLPRARAFTLSQPRISFHTLKSHELVVCSGGSEPKKLGQIWVPARKTMTGSIGEAPRRGPGSSAP